MAEAHQGVAPKHKKTGLAITTACYLFALAGGTLLVLSGVQLLRAYNPNSITETERMTTMLDIGRDMNQQIKRAVDPCIRRTQMAARSPEVIAALQSGSEEIMTKACNRVLTGSTEIDAFALFDAQGQIQAINTVYANQEPIDAERVQRILGMDFNGRDIIQSCTNNRAETAALEFQTTCDITPAFFDSSGLSVAYSVPVIDQKTQTQVGVASSRLRFERISDLFNKRDLGQSENPVELITDEGGYFSETYNTGEAAPPIDQALLQQIVSPLVQGASPYAIQRIEDKIVCLFRLDEFQTLAGGGIQVMLHLDDATLLQEAQAAALLRAMPLLGLSVLLLATAGVLFFYQRQGRLKSLNKQIEDEVHRRSTELESAQAELLKAQKLESVGQLASGIAHEINTPAQYVNDNIRFLQNEFENLVLVMNKYAAQLDTHSPAKSWEERAEEVTQTLEKVDYTFLKEEIPCAIQQSQEGIERITKIVLAMKEFSHPGTGEMKPTDLNHAIDSTITVCSNRWKYAADLKLDLQPNLPSVPCMVGELNQVILNIVVNAADAIEEQNQGTNTKGLITVQSRLVDDDVEIRITDDGGGIPEAIREKIFDPFFTTKDVGKGTGQGLSISHDVITHKHGGQLLCETNPGVGTTFVIKLPAYEVTQKEAA